MRFRIVAPAQAAFVFARVRPSAVVVLLAAILCAAPAFARDPAPAKSAATPAPPAAPVGAKSPLGTLGMGAHPGLPGLPEWITPEQYSVDMVMTHEGESVTMHRSIDAGRIRSDISAQGHAMVMLERPEDGGAIYNIMPSEKMIMKMTPGAMPLPPGAQKREPTPEREPAPPKVEKLGEEKLDGHAAIKYRMISEGHSALAWFDAASGAPLRMEAEGAAIEWKNLKAGAQPAKLFELPKDYQLIDMDEQMKQMQKMQQEGGGPDMAGMAGAMAAARGRGGKAGMGAMPMPGGMSMMGGGPSGMAGNFGAQAGSNFGESIGSGIGASFGGPLGAMAGRYIGGRVGGWVGRKTADMVTPGPPSR